MSALFALALAALAQARTAPPEPSAVKEAPEAPKSSRIASYEIRVALDAAKHELAADETLRYRNDSSVAIPELQLHLYLNAFRNSQTTWMRENSGIGLEADFADRDWGWIEVDSFKLGDTGPDLTKDLVVDDTVLTVKLPEPLAPGATGDYRVRYRAKLPRVIARTGYYGKFHLVAQWFPKIGVWQRSGSESTWSWYCPQFHANSEFFADYGVYDVWLTLPKEYKVGATGKLAEAALSEDSSTQTLHYHAEDVHDFAWTAQPDYVDVDRNWNGVEIVLLCQPSHAAQRERFLTAVQAGIDYYGRSYGAYPYRKLTVVDPAVPRAGGMEYPTFITGDSYFFMPEGIRLPEEVLIHEFGHQYWYGLVGSNEFEEAWLDEGFNSYSTWKAMESRYGNVIDFAGLHLSELDVNRLEYLSGPKADPILRRSWEYRDSMSYGIGSYMKPALVLRTFENLVGSDKMGEILRTYSERWWWKHPTTADFLATVRDVTHDDWSWYFDQVLKGTDLLDYAVTRVESAIVPPAVGFGPGPEPELQPYAKSKESVASAEKSGGAVYESEVLVERLGEVVVPVDIVVRFEGGKEIRESWDGRDRWKRFRYRDASKVAEAIVDPDRKYLLDANFTNNGRRREPESVGVARLLTRWLFWIENAVRSAAIFY